MDERELKKLNIHKDNIRKYISRLYNTTSVTAESSITEDLLKEVKKVDIAELINLSQEFDVFGKCVFHYRLPIDIRIDIDFSKATEVTENERLAYWKEYREKLKNMKYNPEEEYNKIILMACTLHVPINVVEENTDNIESNVAIDGENPINVVEIENNNSDSNILENDPR